MQNCLKSKECLILSYFNCLQINRETVLPLHLVLCTLYSVQLSLWYTYSMLYSVQTDKLNRDDFQGFFQVVNVHILYNIVHLSTIVSFELKSSNLEVLSDHYTVTNSLFIVCWFNRRIYIDNDIRPDDTVNASFIAMYNAL